MRLALAQMDILWEDKEKNKEKILTFLKEAQAKKADLVFFPEMTLTGFSMNVSKIGDPSSNTFNTTSWFADRAKEFNLHIGFGYVEFNNGLSKGLNKFAVVSPDNGVISDYSKIHPFSLGLESQHYVGGNSLSSFNLKDFSISTFICYDLRFPEIFQAASKKSSLLVIIANWPKSRREHWITLLKARAIENQSYVAGINRVGIGDNIEYYGDSIVVSPKGTILCHSENKEELLIQDIQIDEVVNVRNKLKLKEDRREDLYKTLY